MTATRYTETDDGLGFYKVTFINADGVSLTRSFDERVFCEEFVRKLKHSKRCRLVCFPNFYD